jgi:hypothetical protein
VRDAQPRPEKPNARATEPKPPRLTLLELASDDTADDDRDDESPNKPYRDEPPPPPPYDLRVEQAVPACGCAGAAIPGEGGSQVVRGISA